MNIIELLEMRKSSFTKSELFIYDQIVDNPDEIMRCTTISSLAQNYGVSQPTLTRFIQKLGYNNFLDFKYDVYLKSKDDLTSDVQQSGGPILQSYANLILKMDSFINNDQLKSIASKLVKARNVIVMGMHKSYVSAELFGYNMMKLGIPTMIFDSDNRLDIEHFIKKEDVLVVFSAEGVSCKDFLASIEVKGAYTVLITQNNKNPSKKYADDFIWLPNSRNQNLKYYLENQVIFMVFSDLLTSFVAKATTKLKEGEQ